MENIEKEQWKKDHLRKIEQLGNLKASEMTVYQKIASEIFIAFINDSLKKGNDLDVNEVQDLADAAADNANIFLEEMISADTKLCSYII